MEKIIKPILINKSNFAQYGDLISTNDVKPIDINAGYAKRFDNLANLIEKQISVTELRSLIANGGFIKPQ